MMRIVPLLLVGFALAPLPAGAAAVEPSKPIGECSREFETRAGEIEAAGVSAAQFFHQCWWHTKSAMETRLPRVRPATQTRTARAKPARTKTARAKTTRTGPTPARATKAAPTETAQKTWITPAEATPRPVPTAAPPRPTMSAPPHLRVAAPSRWSTGHRVAARRRLDAPRGVAVSRDRVRTALGRGAGPRWAWRRERKRIAGDLRELRVGRSVAIDRPTDHRRRRDVEPARFVDMPRDAREGRRAWIGVATAAGADLTPAVLLGSLRDDATHGAGLHCWGQDVLFVRRHRSQMRAALVCDDKVEVGANAAWFEAYASSR